MRGRGTVTQDEGIDTDVVFALNLWDRHGVLPTSGSSDAGDAGGDDSDNGESMHGRKYSSDEDGDGPESEWHQLFWNARAGGEFRVLNMLSSLRQQIEACGMYREAPMRARRLMGLALRLLDEPVHHVPDLIFEMDLEREYLFDHWHSARTGEMAGALIDRGDHDIYHDLEAEFRPLEKLVVTFAVVAASLAASEVPEKGPAIAMWTSDVQAYVDMQLPGPEATLVEHSTLSDLDAKRRR